MNDMAMVEYLLKRYIHDNADAKNAQAWGDSYYQPYHEGAADEIENIIADRFGMRIEETDTEIRAYNSVCLITVRKETLK